MKRGFSFLEIIFALIISSLFVVVGLNIMAKTIYNYRVNYEYRVLNLKANVYQEKLTNLFKNVIPNTIIGDKCTISNNDCFNGNITNFDSLASITEKNENSQYPVIEFLKENNYIDYFAWNDTLKQNIPSSSKFVDLADTKIIDQNKNEYQIFVKYSDFPKVFSLLNEYFNDYGLSFSYKNLALLMSGQQDNGAISTIKNSYGYNGTPALKLFKILTYKHIISSNPNNNEDILTIEPYNNTTGIITQPYQTFFIIDSAYALVPKENSNGLLDIYLFHFYYPWEKETYKNARVKELFLTNLSKFIVKEIDGSVYVDFCVENPTLKINGEAVQVCREFFKY